MIIRVENYCTAQLSVVDGEYRTTKRDKDMHGYGIKSIRYTAEKYGGSVSADCSDNWFHLSVLPSIAGKSLTLYRKAVRLHGIKSLQRGRDEA